MEQIVTYLAPIATTIAAFIVASNFGSRVTGVGFIVFTVGSIAWAALGLMTGQPNLLWQNVALTALNAFGIWRWLGRQARIEDGAEAAAKESEQHAGEDLFPISILSKAATFGSDNHPIGHCVEAMAGCSSGRVHYLMVAEGGVAGVGETLRRLPWQGCSVRGEQVRAPVTQSEFCSLERIEGADWPAR